MTRFDRASHDEPVAFTVQQALSRLEPSPGLVVLMCGVAGSGKTTFSQALEAKGFARLSIDEEVWATSGRYGIDYSPADHGARLALARAAIKQQLSANLASRTPTVVDSSFWSLAHRNEYKALVEAAGCSWRLVYLKTAENVLAARIAGRRDRIDANAALPITSEVLRGFLRSFEEPSGEGELVVVADD